MGWLFHDTVFILVLEVEFESYNIVNVPIFCNLIEKGPVNMRKTCPAQKGHPYMRKSWPLAHALIWLGILKSLQFVRCALSTPPPLPAQ